MMQAYNDGIIVIKKQVDKEKDFSKKSESKEFKTLYNLRYKELSKRQQDTEFIDSLGHTLNLKIKVRMIGVPLTGYSAFINGDVYSIVYEDYNKVDKEQFIYLEKAGIGNA